MATSAALSPDSTVGLAVEPLQRRTTMSYAQNTGTRTSEQIHADIDRTRAELSGDAVL